MRFEPLTSRSNIFFALDKRTMVCCTLLRVTYFTTVNLLNRLTFFPFHLLLFCNKIELKTRCQIYVKRCQECLVGFLLSSTTKFSLIKTQRHRFHLVKKKTDWANILSIHTIVKILNFYIILYVYSLVSLLSVSIHSLQCIHCLLH